MTQSLFYKAIRKTCIIAFVLLIVELGFSQENQAKPTIQIPEFQGQAIELVEELNKQSKFSFSYSSKVDLTYDVAFQEKLMLLSDFLNQLLDSQEIEYRINGQKVILYPKRRQQAKPVKLSQTVRGIVFDIDSKTTLVGATVAILNSNPLIGVSSDLNGKFRLEKVPVGRISLQVSFMGYESQTIPNLVITSGKEVIVEVAMKEAVVNMDEVLVRPDKKKGEAINEMALLSARSISPEESKRFANPFNDPSRKISSYTGVAHTPNGSNDIIVRGNSPKYIQWRLEGIQITNPNHFGDINGVGSGGVSALNNDLLATSDFYTGAFAPEFGDALSGVYDIKLRAGNNEKFESKFGLGLMGTDITLEGPFKKGYGGSFLVNYRYSTVGLIKDLGIVNVNGTPTFQDATFKIVLPTKKIGRFSIFGIAGLSGYLIEDMPEADWRPGPRNYDSELAVDHDTRSHLMNTGINHLLPINKNSFIETKLSYSSDGMTDKVFQTDKHTEAGGGSASNKQLNYDSRLLRSTYRASLTYNNKINAKNRIQIGSKYTLNDYNTQQSRLEENNIVRFDLTDFEENIASVRNFISWKYRLNEKITMVAGLHNMNVLFNSKHTLEPRLAFSWKVNEISSFRLGYGKHSSMESVHNYFAKVQKDDGTVEEPNRDLDLLKADHFVFSYETRFAENLMAKLELYYQNLYDLPVENIDTSYYATINESTDYRFVDLVNEGTGRNYGVELTLERFFDNNYYFYINGSLFESKYTPLDGIERNTRYNTNYIANFLVGKEFVDLGRKNNQVLAINLKAFYMGGQKQVLLLKNEDGSLAVDPGKNLYWDYERAFENKLDDIFQLNVSVSYKINRPKSSHEIVLNVYNASNQLGRLAEYYDVNEPNSIGYNLQQEMFPDFMYRIYF